MYHILIIDDDRDICLLLEKFLSKKGYETKSALNGESAESLLKKNSFDLVLCDFKLPDYDGLDMLKKIKIISPTTQVIIITGYSDVKVAVKTLKLGAYDYVTKPLFPDEILLTIESALKEVDQIESEDNLKKKSPKGAKSTIGPDTDFIQGISHAAKTIQKHIDLIAPTNMSVIITGETGTGKEFVAKAIHRQSDRKNKPFVALDCGALPKELAGSELFGHVKGAFTGAINDKKGCFELANGGTLFLDEISNLTYENQVKLLRVLQERQIKKVGGTNETSVDVRVIVATNEDLKEAVKNGDFREDIYHRLNEFRIELSSLRQRQDDIPVFAERFLQLANSQLNKSVEGFSTAVSKSLREYYWHGNLRELRNVIKRSVLLCQTEEITPDCLPVEIVEPELHASDIISNDPVEMPTDLKSVSELAEKKAIIEVLKKTGNNKSKTAEILNVDRKTLYNKLKAYNIDM